MNTEAIENSFAEYLEEQGIGESCRDSLMEFLASALKTIEEAADKNLVLSTFDLSDLLEEYLSQDDSICEDENDKDLESIIITFFSDQELVYTWRDRNSYLKLVRSRGKLSLQEDIMQKSLGRGIKFRDTEFPVNDNGEYIVN